MAIWRVSHEKQFSGKWFKNCQEIEELRRISFEFIDLDNWELMSFLRRKKGESTVNQLLAQIQDMQDQANSLTDARESYYLETASTSGVHHAPRGMLASIFLAAWYTGLFRLPEDTCLKRLCLAVPRNVKFGCWFAHWRSPCSWIMGCGDGSVTFLKRTPIKQWETTVERKRSTIKFRETEHA